MRPGRAFTLAPGIANWTPLITTRSSGFSPSRMLRRPKPSVATTKPVRDLLDERNAAIYEIGLRHLQLSPATAADAETTGRFQEGLVKLRVSEGLFVEQPYGVQVTDRILYRARLPIPSAVPVGNYQAEIYLISDGRVRARSTAPVIIDKTGFERSLYVFAQDHGFLYGLFAVALAVAMGVAAGQIGRRA